MLIKLHCADFFPPPSLPFRCKCVLCCISPDLLGLCEGDGGGCHSLVAMDILCLLCTWHEHPPGHLDPISSTVDEFKYH